MEITNLKEKCNSLIDEINQIQKRIEEKEKILELLEQKQLMSSATEPTEKKKLQTTELEKIPNDRKRSKRDFLVFVPLFAKVVQKMVENNEFYTYKNYSSLDRKYRKVEKKIFDKYISDDANYDNREFYELAIDYLLIRQDGKRFAFPNDGKQFIYINRKAMENFECYY